MADDFGHLARILDQTNLVIHRQDGTILYWTAGCERLYGWTKQDAVGQSCMICSSPNIRNLASRSSTR